MFNFFKSKNKIKEQEEKIMLLQKELSELKKQQSNMMTLNEHKNILNHEIEKLSQNVLLQQKRIIEKDIEINQLNNDINSLTAENNYLNCEIENINKYKQQSKEKEKIQKQQDDYYYNHLQEYYYFKSSVFTTHEQYLYYYLDEWTKSNQYKYKDKYYDKYKVFPKLRLADILATDEEKKKMYQEICDTKNTPIVYEITSKHIDFTICELINPGRNTKYKPILFIELNGESHQTDERTKRNDDYKKKLFETLKVPIITIENTDLNNICTNGKISEFLKKFIKTP